MFTRFVKNDAGTMVVEYGLVAALVAVSVVVGAALIGSSIDEDMTTLSTTVEAPRV